MARIKNKNGKTNIIKRFIGNKNTVAILGILACAATLIVGYNYRVRNAISPVTVPYAKVSIPAKTTITSEMVGRVMISQTYSNQATNLIKSIDEVINKKSTYRSAIPKGSLFYNELVIDEDEMPDAAFENIEDGYTIYSLSVNNESTYSNQIRAGDYIDLYMSATELETGNIIFGKLIESIRVLAVKDSTGTNILTYSSSQTPSELLFAVKDDMYELLMVSEFISGNVKITPVLRNKNYTSNAGETNVSSEYLQAYIEDNIAIIDEN